MNAASVGFQCPECVREGHRATRTGRTAYGGLRPTDASLTTMVLIGLNAIVWLLINVTGRYGSRLYDVFSLKASGVCEQGNGYYPSVPEAICGRIGAAHWAPGVSDGAVWQLITAGFGHVEVWHIVSNMFFLYIVGPQLEVLFGRARFLALYFLSLLAGSTLVYWAAPEHTATLGASGAIFGLMAAILVISVKRHADLRQILILIALNFGITFALSGISWQGHVGGFVGGALTAGILAYAPAGPRRMLVQVGGLACLGVVLVVLVAVRSAALG